MDRSRIPKQVASGAAPDRLFELLREVKALAREYHDLTGRALGVTGEIAEYEAARHLGVQLAPARQRGYDAVRASLPGRQLLQIKGRCVTHVGRRGQRVGSIDLDKPWDTTLLVLLDEHYETIEILEADRRAITGVLRKPGSRARNERGQLSVAQFRAIARVIWSR